MFNLTEKHIVVVLVLITVIFLLFLSTRTPMCAKEGFINSDHYAEFNNDLFMDKDSFAPVGFDNKIKETNNNSKPILLTKSDMNDLKGIDGSDNDNDNIITNFDNDFDDNINNDDKKTYASVSDNINEPKIEDIIETKITEPKDKPYEANNIQPSIEKPLLNDKPLEYANDCVEVPEIPEVPEGRDINYNYSPYGLSEEINKSYTLNNSQPELDEGKCSIFRDAVLHLNKTGSITNDNVVNSWNNTFKDTCGYW